MKIFTSIKEEKIFFSILKLTLMAVNLFLAATATSLITEMINIFATLFRFIFFFIFDIIILSKEKGSKKYGMESSPLL